MRGLDPRIHDELQHAKPHCHSGGAASWIAGSSPAMTVGGQCALHLVKFIAGPAQPVPAEGRPDGKSGRTGCPRMTPMFWRRLYLLEL